MIKNLTPQLNEHGKIKIGVKGESITSSQGNEFRPPKKIDHFLLTTTEKNDDGDYIVDVDLVNRIKEAGTGVVNAEGNLTGIPIRLLYENIEQNFPTRYACYSGRNLNCSGDGEVSHKRIDDYKKEHPCPCERLAPDYDGKHKCKANGRLICMIDEAGLFGQAHVFRTTGINSVRGIWGGMELIKVATKGRLAGIPLMLTLSAKHTEHGTAYIVSVCFNGTMDLLRDTVHDLAMKEKVYLLDMPQTQGVIEQGSDDEQDFVEEFYPQEAGNPGKAITEKTIETNNGIKEAKSEAKPEPEVEKDPQPPIIDDIHERLLISSNSYASIYNRFMIAVNKHDYKNANSLAGRMTKEYLEMFFTRERPDIVFQGKPKKTDYVAKIAQMLDHPAPMLMQERPVIEEDAGENKDEHVNEEPAGDEHPFLTEIKAMGDREKVAQAMTEFFKPLPVNLTLDLPGLIAWAEQRIGNPTEEVAPKQDTKQPGPQDSQGAAAPGTDDPGDDEEENPEGGESIDRFAFDKESGDVAETQLKTLVVLKNKLKKADMLDDDQFKEYVQQFKDVDGNAMASAVKFSFDQGFSFIDMLNELLPEDERMPNVPF